MTVSFIRQACIALFALAVAASAGAPASAEPATTDRDRVLPIAAARHRALGTTVTVRGTVSVPSNAFDPGFAIQQASSGIYVLASGGAARALGDRVEVTGTLVDTFGLLTIQPTRVTAQGHGDQVRPRRHRTGAVGERTEGELIKVRGTMIGDVVDDGEFGFKLDIDDGSGPLQLFMFPGTGISTAGLEDGAEIEAVCFSGQFDVFIECNPRSQSDLEID